MTHAGGFRSLRQSRAQVLAGSHPLLALLRRLSLAQAILRFANQLDLMVDKHEDTSRSIPAIILAVDNEQPIPSTRPDQTRKSPGFRPRIGPRLSHHQQYH